MLDPYPLDKRGESNVTVATHRTKLGAVCMQQIDP